METRLAQAEDVAEIVRIFSSCWPGDHDDTSRLPVQFNRHRQGNSNEDGITIVAPGDDAIKGFVDCFFTTEQAGLVRLEIDILAVDPASRRQGVASALVYAAEELGQLRAPCTARVVVQANNSQMNGLMGNVGYQASGTHDLYIKPVVSAVEKADWVLTPGFVRVDTLRYSGIWVETLISEECLQRAEKSSSALGLDLVGALIDVQDMSSSSIAKQQGYMEVGVYRYWEKTLQRNAIEMASD